MEEPKGFGRRDFLKGLSAAALAAGTVGSLGVKGAEAGYKLTGPPPPGHFGTKLLPHPNLQGSAGSEKFWKDVREQFVLPNNYIHMNTGTTGSVPLFAMQNLAVYNLWKSMDPRDWQANLNKEYPELFPFYAPPPSTSGSAIAARQKLVADIYGANQDEIILSYDTTDAMNWIFNGTPWNPGDRIVTTQMEHPAGNGPMAFVRDYRGVNLVSIDIPSNFTSNITVPQVVSWFEPALAAPLPPGAKQYLVFSEIFYKNGLRMPVREMVQLAQSYGAYSIVDSAHAWGMLPVDCHEYEADFICGAGHKWLCGGPGTGIWYMRNQGSNLPPFGPINASYGDQFTAPSPNYNNRNWKPASLLQSRGEYNTPALYAMTDVLNFFNYIGIDRIYERGTALGNYLKDKVAAKWSPGALSVQKNPDPKFWTFLTAVNPFKGKNDSAQFAAMNSAINTILGKLAGQDPKIYIRSITWRDKHTDPADNRVAFRIGTHAMYNNYEEINTMFDALVKYVNESGLAQLP